METSQEYGTIEREIHIDAAPEVVFELEAAGEGTRLRMTERGFRERGWDEAKVAHEYADHVSGWDFFLPRLPPYAVTVGATA